VRRRYYTAWSSRASADGGGVVTCEIDQGGEGGESGCPSLDDTGCQPGASHSISSGGGCVELTAQRDIAAGEEITITYAADAPSDAFALYMVEIATSLHPELRSLNLEL